VDDAVELEMWGFPHADGPLARKGLGGDAWGGFDPKELEGDAEPRREQGPMKTKVYI